MWCCLWRSSLAKNVLVWLQQRDSDFVILLHNRGSRSCTSKSLTTTMAESDVRPFLPRAAPSPFYYILTPLIPSMTTSNIIVRRLLLGNVNHSSIIMAFASSNHYCNIGISNQHRLSDQWHVLKRHEDIVMLLQQHSESWTSLGNY